MLSLWYSVLFCFCIYRLECSKAKVGLGWMERLLNASLLRALLWFSRLIIRDTPIIHTKLNILKLGLNLGHILFQWWPCTTISNQSLSSILNSTFWYWVLALVLCCFSDDHVSSILNSTYWYWVLAWVICCFSDDHVPSYQTNPYHPIQHFGIGSWLSSYDVLVMTMYHHMKSIPIIHSRFDILVLGLGQGLMLFQWWPCTIISNQSLSSILNLTYWYWVLAKVICCFSDDHVPSYQTNRYHLY